MRQGTSLHGRHVRSIHGISTNNCRWTTTSRFHACYYGVTMSAAKLLNLSTDIWRDRVIQMLRMSEVVRLDSTVGNHKDRSHFLFDIGTFHQALVLDGNEDERLRWCSEHRLFPTSVVLEKSLEDDSCAWAEKVLSQVTQVTFEGKSTCWEELIGYCTSPITHLSFRLCTLLDEESLTKNHITITLHTHWQLWEVLVPSRLIRVNSFAGHRWHIVVDNVRVATWTVVNDPKANQDFVVSYKVNEFACLCGGGV